MSYCKCDRCAYDAKNGGTEKQCEKCVGWNGDQFMFKDIDDYEKYPIDIMRNVRENMGLDQDDDSRDDEILNEMDRVEVFRRVLEWEGIFEYTGTILQWIDDIFNVNLEEV